MNTESIDLLDLYMRDVRRVARQRGRLSAAELASLHEAYKAGDATARNRLWEEAIGLVIFEANRMALRNAGGNAVDLDVFQEGMIAAGKALDSWQPDKGAFSTWVVVQAKGAMLDYRAKEMRKGIGSKEAPLLSVVMLDDNAGVIDDHEASDLPGAEAHDESSAHDAVDLGGYPPPDHCAYLQQVRAAVESIEDADIREVVTSYYGLDGNELTLQEIANNKQRAVSWVHGKLRAGHHLVEKTLKVPC